MPASQLSRDYGVGWRHHWWAGKDILLEAHSFLLGKAILAQAKHAKQKRFVFSNCVPSENSAQHKKEHTQGVPFPRTQWLPTSTRQQMIESCVWMWITVTLCMVTEAPFHVLLSLNFPTNTCHLKMTISSSFWVYLFHETLLFLLSTQAERAIGWWHWNTGLFLY